MLGGGGIEGREVGRTGGREREAGEEGREEGEDRHSNKYISCTNSKENLGILFAKPQYFLCETQFGGGFRAEGAKQLLEVFFRAEGAI